MEHMKPSAMATIRKSKIASRQSLAFPPHPSLLPHQVHGAYEALRYCAQSLIQNCRSPVPSVIPESRGTRDIRDLGRPGKTAARGTTTNPGTSSCIPDRCASGMTVCMGMEVDAARKRKAVRHGDQSQIQNPKSKTPSL